MSRRGSFTLWWQAHTRFAHDRVSPRARRLIRALWAASLFVLGGLLLRRLSTFADWRAAWSRSLELGAPLLVLLAMPAVAHFVKMLGWRSLLRPSERPSLAEAYAAFVAAQAVNELGFSVLGEPLKILVLPRSARAAGLKAVVTDNVVALTALLAVIGTLLVGSPIVVACVLGAVALRLRLRREQEQERERGWLLAFAAHYAGKLWLVAEIALGLHLLGEASLAAAAPLSLAWLGAAAIGAPVPAQLGVVEAALMHTGTGLGLAAPTLLSLALIRRARGLLWLLLGLVLAARIVHCQSPKDSNVSTTVA
jgi:hypothetical protein